MKEKEIKTGDDYTRSAEAEPGSDGRAQWQNQSDTNLRNVYYLCS